METDLAYLQDIEDCLADRIGPAGLSGEELDALFSNLESPRKKLCQMYKNGGFPLLELPAAREDLKQLEPIAQRYRQNFTDVVILGTGGSSLGGKALYEMARPKGSAADSGWPILHIVTNIDPFSFGALVARLDYKKTGFIVISKSGGTAETVMQFLSILPYLKAAVGEERLKDFVTLITEPGDTPLRRLGGRFSLPVLDHHPGIGGRYSVLSLVGMLPAMIGGLDALEVRQGAENMLQKALDAKISAHCPAAVGAAVAVGLSRYHGISNTVMLAYSDRLGSLARWYRQLWAESLGKKGMGTTPIYGTGPVDQHSQLQLWLDGPTDKMFTVLGGPVARGSQPVDPGLADDPALSYMAGCTMGDLMEASRRATAETLAESGKPVRLVTVEEINATSMGALMMHFMLETIFAADLMDVDPYDQPAVERGKILTRRYMAEMGKKG